MYADVTGLTCKQGPKCRLGFKLLSETMMGVVGMTPFWRSGQLHLYLAQFRRVSVCWGFRNVRGGVKCGHGKSGAFQVQNMARIKLKPGACVTLCVRVSPIKALTLLHALNPGPGASWLFLESNNTKKPLNGNSGTGPNFKGQVHKEGVENGQVQVVAGPQLQEVLDSNNHNTDIRCKRVMERLEVHKPQKSTDGVGSNASMVFIMEISWSQSGSLINPFSGVSMKVVHDSRTSRDYLYFAEGPSHAVFAVVLQYCMCNGCLL